MRCTPHAIAFAEDPQTLIQVSKQSSAITHYVPRCTYGCAVLNCTITGYLRGDNHPFEDALAHVEGDAPEELVETLRLVPNLVDNNHLTTPATSFIRSRQACTTHLLPLHRKIRL